MRWQHNVGRHGCSRSRHHRCAATVLYRGGDEDTNGGSKARSQTTINNNLKAATATATKTVTMTASTMTVETKATRVATTGTVAAAEARRQHRGGQLGDSSGSLVRAWCWQRRQQQCGSGGGGGGQLGSKGVSLGEAGLWRQQQHIGKRSSAAATVAETRHWRWWWRQGRGGMF